MADRTPLQQPAASRRLDRYEVIGEIAKGGMGTVLLARLAGAGGFQRLFAIKLLHEQYAADAELTEMLLDEARIAARIHHPNVVSIQEVCESDDHGYYLVMDYIEGFPLWDICQAMNLPQPDRWRITNRIVLDALNGLEAAHGLVDDDGVALHVVHRDVSPQNILVGVDGIARVTDFGIAKAAARISSTRAGQVKGKLAYMSPEQARGQPLDRRTDLFAMGTVLWETLTTRRLFRASTETATFRNITAAPIPRVRDLVQDVPLGLDAVCARALARDPDGRFASAREMAQALETAARAQDLLSDAHEVGAWIRETFAAELGARRAAIRAAASVQPARTGDKVSYLPGGLCVPQLPETSPSIVAPPGARAVSGVVPVDEWDDARDTGVVEDRGDDEAATASLQIENGAEAFRNALARTHGGASAALVQAPVPPLLPMLPKGPAASVSGGFPALSASASGGFSALSASVSGGFPALPASTSGGFPALPGAGALASVTPAPVTSSPPTVPTSHASPSHRRMVVALVGIGIAASAAAVGVGMARANRQGAQVSAAAAPSRARAVDRTEAPPVVPARAAEAPASPEGTVTPPPGPAPERSTLLEPFAAPQAPQAPEARAAQPAPEAPESPAGPQARQASHVRSAPQAPAAPRDEAASEHAARVPVGRSDGGVRRPPRPRVPVMPEDPPF